MRRYCFGVAVVAVAFVAFGFASDLHRSAETLAMLRPIFAVMLLLGVWAAHRDVTKIGFALSALVALLSVVLPFFPQSPGADLRIYSKNLGYFNTQVDEIVADIEAANVDAVLLQEVVQGNIAILAKLAATFPHQHYCAFNHALGIAVVSRRPFEGTPKCSRLRAVVAAPIRVQGKRIWLASVHLPWPWPFPSRDNENAAKAIFKGLDGPVVIAGDFNILPWSGRVTGLQRLTDTRFAGPARTSYWLGPIPLAIDHILSPNGGATTLRPRFGSDHAGIVGDLKL